MFCMKLFTVPYMKESRPKRLKKRIVKSWFTSLVSITLVLVMLGALGLILVNARQLSDYVREKIGFTLVLHDQLKDSEITRLQKKLEATDYVKSTRYIDKETASRELTQNLGEDFNGFLGYNPLFASFEVKLYAAYTNADSLLTLEKEFLAYPQVQEVFYQKDLVEVINKNVRRITLIILVLSALLTFIFIALINNTIRISVYSQRFTINTMQMVGASNALIRAPFLKQSLFLGIYGSLLANLILFAAVFSYQKELRGIIALDDVNTTGVVFLLVIAMGLLFSLISTYFAVNKFLKMKFDEMFY